MTEQGRTLRVRRRSKKKQSMIPSQYNPVKVTQDYQASDGDLVLADSSAGSIKIDLPDPKTDAQITVKNTGTDSVFVKSPKGHSIDGDGFQEILSFGSRTIVGVGGNFYVL